MSSLLAVSHLHAAYADNRGLVEGLRPRSGDDWLLVAGDVAERVAGWHVRYGAVTVVYGHLHVPRTTWHDGVRFEEVSLGYPRDWRARAVPPELPRVVLEGSATPIAVR